MKRKPKVDIHEYILLRLRQEALVGTELIPELVDGRTVAEVERSIVQARAAMDRRRAYFDALVPTQEEVAMVVAAQESGSAAAA